MSKSIKIPECRGAVFEVIVNGKAYSYPAGETVTVPDAVAEMIEKHIEEHDTPEKNNQSARIDPLVAEAIHNAIEDCHPSLEEGVEKKSSRTYNGKPIYSKAMTMIAPEIKGNTNYERLCDGAVSGVVSIHSTIVRNDGKVYANNEVLRIYVTSTDRITKLAVEYPADAPGGKYAGAIVRSIIEYTKE